MLISIVLGDEYFTSYPGSLGILRRGPKPKAPLVGILRGDTNPSENIHGKWKIWSGQPFQGGFPGE